MVWGCFGALLRRGTNTHGKRVKHKPGPVVCGEVTGDGE